MPTAYKGSMPLTTSQLDIAPERLSRKESSELEYTATSRGDPGTLGTNSNGTLNTLNEGSGAGGGAGGVAGGATTHNGATFSPDGDESELNVCFNSVKSFCRNRGCCGTYAVNMFFALS